MYVTRKDLSRLSKLSRPARSARMKADLTPAFRRWFKTTDLFGDAGTQGAPVPGDAADLRRRAQALRQIKALMALLPDDWVLEYTFSKPESGDGPWGGWKKRTSPYASRDMGPQHLVWFNPSTRRSGPVMAPVVVSFRDESVLFDVTLLMKAMHYRSHLQGIGDLVEFVNVCLRESLPYLAPEVLGTLGVEIINPNPDLLAPPHAIAEDPIRKVLGEYRMHPFPMPTPQNPVTPATPTALLEATARLKTTLEIAESTAVVPLNTILDIANKELVERAATIESLRVEVARLRERPTGA